MTTFSTVGQAMLLGAAIAAPVGPMSVLLMRRSLTRGWRSGIVIGLGIATGDGIYATISALGLAAIVSFMAVHARVFHLAAAAVLIVLGVRAFLARPAERAAVVDERRAYAATVGLTLTNPMTIVAFAAALSLLPAAGSDRAGYVVAVAVGVFAGSLAWWAVLAAVVSSAGRVLGDGVRRWVDRVSGVALTAMGVRLAVVD